MVMRTGLDENNQMEEDPFAFIIEQAYISPSQEEILRTTPLVGDTGRNLTVDPINDVEPGEVNQVVHHVEADGQGSVDLGKDSELGFSECLSDVEGGGLENIIESSFVECRGEISVSEDKDLNLKENVETLGLNQVETVTVTSAIGDADEEEVVVEGSGMGKKSDEDLGSGMGCEKKRKHHDLMH